MAVATPPGTSLRQINETVGRDSQGNEVRTVIFRDGSYDVLDTWQKTLNRGDTLDGENGWLINSWRLTKNPGGTGTLEIELTPEGGTSGSGQQQKENQPLDETWQLKSCRNDMSILAYCGPAADSPCREWIEAWQKEPDGDLAKQNRFTKPDGTVFDIANPYDSDDTDKGHATIELMAKIREGVEGVMRFYPMLIKTRIYAKPPATVFENLSCIDTPEITGATAKTFTAPGNLAQIIGAWVWLKCQDDTEKTADGKHRRVEAWIGATAWDENLYGTTNRWPMPYHYSSDGEQEGDSSGGEQEGDSSGGEQEGGQTA